ncbi:hypothetical protein SSX86_025505 [Deinandra increscens subsp. villosa]|uniref:Uncharacterized protein n=1 Tax=Deinandra increscens subsp. villosa TaxID=3103831 RepID=A0AAP0CIN7_9ASTR
MGSTAETVLEMELSDSCGQGCAPSRAGDQTNWRTHFINGRGRNEYGKDRQQWQRSEMHSLEERHLGQSRRHWSSEARWQDHSLWDGFILRVATSSFFTKQPVSVPNGVGKDQDVLVGYNLAMYRNGALKLLQLFWETNTKLTIQNGDDGATIDFSFAGVRNLHELVAQEVTNMGLDCLWI